MSFIEFKNVKKIYQMGEITIPALNGVDFEVEKGEFVIVAGASGAGKSTHAALLKRYAPENTTIINDDKPLIKISNTECEVFGTP